jgi:pilus assembly protein CpaE
VTASADRLPPLLGPPLEAPGPLVAVVEREPEVRRRIRDALPGADVMALSSLDELVDVGLQRVSVIVVVLGPSQVEPGPLQRFGSLARLRSGLGGILVVETVGPEVMGMALRAGLDDAIAVQNLDSQLLSAVQALGQRLDEDVAGIVQLRQLNRATESRGRVTTVFSPKGGVGKSVVAVNLAAALARRSPEPVVVLDLDLQFGDVAVMVRLQPAHNVTEVVAAERAERIDGELVHSLLVRHPSSGVFVLAAPPEPSLVDSVDAKVVSRLVAVLRSMASRVVVDTPSVLSDAILQVLDDSDDIAFVVGMDVPSVKNARIGLHALRLVGIDERRILLVLNRADSKVNLSVRDVERALRMKVAVSLPSDVLVTQSVNKGIPAVLEYERSGFARAIDQLVEVVRGRSGAAVEREA